MVVLDQPNYDRGQLQWNTTTMENNFGGKQNHDDETYGQMTATQYT